ncbi:MAG: amino acid permease [Bacteroidetes bacterium]|nr:amino acid permease [Bacteroidota bacterium]
MPKLNKSLTLYGLTMVVIGSCVGSGIFLTPAQIAGHLPSANLILGVWILGGVIAISGALTFAELGAMFPKSGGLYVFLKNAYGDLFGFLYGWATLLVVTTGAIAALCLGCATYINKIIPLGDGGMKLVAIGLIVTVTLINIRGVKFGELFSNVFTGLKLLGIAGLIALAFVVSKINIEEITKTSSLIEGNITGAVGLALIGVIFSYGGFQHASYLAGEAKDPIRTVPRAMIIGTIIVTIVYFLTNLAYIQLLPIEEIAASSSVAADAVETVLPIGGLLIAIIIAISTFGTAGIYTMTSPRIYYAMAKDGNFFSALAKVSEKYRTPVFAILLQSAWAIVLLNFWETFENLIAYVLFTDWIFMTLAAISIFVFRIKRKDTPRPYKTLGYPVVPLIFIVLSIFVLVSTLIGEPSKAFAGLGILAIGTIVFFIFKSKKT